MRHTACATPPAAASSKSRAGGMIGGAWPMWGRHVRAGHTHTPTAHSAPHLAARRGRWCAGGLERRPHVCDVAARTSSGRLGHASSHTCGVPPHYCGVRPHRRQLCRPPPRLWQLLGGWRTLRPGRPSPCQPAHVLTQAVAGVSRPTMPSGAVRAAGGLRGGLTIGSCAPALKLWPRPHAPPRTPSAAPLKFAGGAWLVAGDTNTPTAPPLM